MLTIIIAVSVTAAVLGIGAALTEAGPWYRDLRKPSWNPPDWVFGPAWTLILGLACWAGVAAWGAAPGPGHKLLVGALFGANVVFHMFWSPLFFHLRRPDWALVEVLFLWGSVLALIVCLAPFSPLSSWLLVPYILWVSFAAVLNFVIVRINPPFGRSKPSEAV
jgi:benzodiazapine receptor